MGAPRDSNWRRRPTKTTRPTSDSLRHDRVRTGRLITRDADQASLSSRSSTPSSRECSCERWDGCHARTIIQPIHVVLKAELIIKLYGEDSTDEDALNSASILPPITKMTLSELDIGCIINNIKLRHDVNFDRELHFRPNMDGDRGRRKRDAQEQYWLAVVVELTLIFHVLPSSHPDSVKVEFIAHCSIRLRKMFESIKDILRALVPERDQRDVDEHLDVDMLMQEISRSACNFVKIAEWMAQLLKRHCAPMRDEMVDGMVSKIALETPESITQGLADLFSILEAMKLDVANHQIRHLRALLIEDTVNFEKKYHLSKMRKNKYPDNCKSARAWYKSARDQSAKDVEVFTKAFFQLLFATGSPLPDTFALDSERIRVIRADIDDMIREKICEDYLESIVKQRGCYLTSEMREEFRNRLRIIVATVKTPAGHLRTVDDIATEMVRAVLKACGSTATVDAELQECTSNILQHQLFTLNRSRGPLVDDSEDRSLIEKYENELFEELFPRILELVSKYITFSPFEIFQALVPPQIPPPPACLPFAVSKVPGKQEDLIRRIAHIAVLHWRTWEGLVYTNEELDLQSDSSEAAAGSMGRRGSVSRPAANVATYADKLSKLPTHGDDEDNDEAAEVEAPEAVETTRAHA